MSYLAALRTEKTFGFFLMQLAYGRGYCTGNTRLGTRGRNWPSLGRGYHYLYYWGLGQARKVRIVPRQTCTLWLVHQRWCHKHSISRHGSGHSPDRSRPWCHKSRHSLDWAETKTGPPGPSWTDFNEKRGTIEHMIHHVMSKVTWCEKKRKEAPDRALPCQLMTITISEVRRIVLMSAGRTGACYAWRGARLGRKFPPYLNPEKP